MVERGGVVDTRVLATPRFVGAVAGRLDEAGELPPHEVPTTVIRAVAITTTALVVTPLQLPITPLAYGEYLSSSDVAAVQSG